MNETDMSVPGIREQKSGIPSAGNGIPIAGGSGMPAGIPNNGSGIPDNDKSTTAKVSSSTKKIVADLKDGSESFDDTIRRVFGKYTALSSENSQLRTSICDLHDTHDADRDAILGKDVVIEGLEHRITGLEADIENLLDSGASTTVLAPIAPGYVKVGGEVVKDMMDNLKDVCNDDDMCIRTAVHLVGKQADLANSQFARDHDRDEREKDRKLKQTMAADKAQHDKDLALIKKGVVKQSDLEDVIFLESVRSTKSAKKIIEERKEQARRASDADEEWEEPEEVD